MTDDEIAFLIQCEWEMGQLALEAMARYEQLLDDPVSAGWGDSGPAEIRARARAWFRFKPTRWWPSR